MPQSNDEDGLPGAKEMCQEKKDDILRQEMMDQRVRQAARQLQQKLLIERQQKLDQMSLDFYKDR